MAEKVRSEGKGLEWVAELTTTWPRVRRLLQDCCRKERESQRIKEIEKRGRVSSSSSASEERGRKKVKVPGQRTVWISFLALRLSFLLPLFFLFFFLLCFLHSNDNQVNFEGREAGREDRGSCQERGKDPPDDGRERGAVYGSSISTFTVFRQRFYSLLLLLSLVYSCCLVFLNSTSSFFSNSLLLVLSEQKGRVKMKESLCMYTSLPHVIRTLLRLLVVCEPLSFFIPLFHSHCCQD